MYQWKILFSEYIEKDSQDYAYDDACRDGKVKTEPFFFDINIARQFAKKRYLIGEQKSKSDKNNDNSNNNQNLTHCGHQTAFQYRSFSLNIHPQHCCHKCYFLPKIKILFSAVDNR